MTTPLPPHIELRVRQCGEAVWNATHASNPDITPKRAFTEGFCIALSTVIEKNVRQQLELEFWRGLACSMLIGIAVAAAAVGVLSR